MKRLILCAALALAAAACDNGAPSNDLTSIAIANPQSDQLKALSPFNQRIGLMRAIRDSGKRCHRVEAVSYQQEYRGLAMWAALCDDGRHWSIFIAPNADIQVRDCTQNAQIDLPLCRPITAPPPDPNAPDANLMGNNAATTNAH